MQNYFGSFPEDFEEERDEVEEWEEEDELEDSWYSSLWEFVFFSASSFFYCSIYFVIWTANSRAWGSPAFDRKVDGKEPDHRLVRVDRLCELFKFRAARCLAAPIYAIFWSLASRFFASSSIYF